MRNPRQISVWSIGSDKSCKEIFAQAKAAGFDGVELSFGEGELREDITREECAAIRRLAATMGVGLHTLASGKYWAQSLTDPDARVRARAVKFLKAHLRAAAWLGAKTILVIPGAVAVPWEKKSKVVPYAEVWGRATQGIRAAIPTAEKAGVTIGVENVWNLFLTDPMAMALFVAQFKSPRVQIYFDVGNCLINGYPEHWIDILGSRIAAVHVKSFRRKDGAGGLSCFTRDLRDSDTNWTAVVAALKRAKYRGALTAEMFPADPAIVRSAGRRMKAIFA